MQITITGKRIELTPAIEDYANKKLDRLQRFYDRIQQIDLVVDRPSAQSSTQFDIEIITRVDRHDPFIATTSGDDVYACIDGAVDKMSRQLSEHKERLRNRKHPS